MPTRPSQLRANKVYYAKNQQKIYNSLKLYYENNAEEIKKKRRLRYLKEQRRKKLNTFIVAHLIKLNIHV